MSKLLVAIINNLNIFAKPKETFRSILIKPNLGPLLVLIILIDLFVIIGGGKISLVLITSVSIAFMILLETFIVYVWAKIRKTKFEFVAVFAAVSLTFFPFIIYHGLNIFIPNILSKLNLGYILVNSGVMSNDYIIAILCYKITIFDLYELYLTGLLVNILLDVSVISAFSVFFILNTLPLIVAYLL